MQTKKCAKCDEYKILEEMVKCAREKDGYTARCKECQRAYYTPIPLEEQKTTVKVRFDEFGKRQCNNCKEYLDITKFGKNVDTTDGYQCWCKQCNNFRGAELREVHKEKLIQQRKVLNRKLKLEILQAYGNKCLCCNEKNIEFLTIDHINGNGSKHRKEVGSGTAFYHWLKKNNFPEGYRVLCFNCNCSLGFFGYCPHNNLQ